MVTILAPLRFLFIALAFALGTGLAAASVLGIWDLLQLETASGSGGPPPFALSSYGYTPITAVTVTLAGLAALKHRWDALALLCWFLLGGAVLEALYVLWILIRYGAMPDSLDAALGPIWALFPALGLLLAKMAQPGGARCGDTAPSLAAQERLRLRNTLIGLAAVSYLWRAVAIALSPGTPYAVAFLRGMSELYGPEQVVLGTLMGAAAAIMLLVCIVWSRMDDRIIHSALAFTAGFALEGSLDTLDYALGFGVFRILSYSLQDVVAFLACGAALALSLRRERTSAPLTVT